MLENAFCLQIYLFELVVVVVVVVVVVFVVLLSVEHFEGLGAALAPIHILTLDIVGKVHIKDRKSSLFMQELDFKICRDQISYVHPKPTQLRSMFRLST